MVACSRNGQLGFHAEPHVISSYSGIWKGHMYVPSNPGDMDDLKTQITEALATIDNAMLGRVWKDPDYRLYAYRVTHGT